MIKLAEERHPFHVIAHRRRPFKQLIDPAPPLNLTVRNTAFLISDVQRLTADESGGVARLAREKGIISEFKEYFEFVRAMLPNIRLIRTRCRELGIKVIFTRLVSRAQDGGDLSRHNKLRRYFYTCDTDDSDFLEKLHPDRGDIIIDKACENPFNCTGLEHILRNLGVKYLILGGVRTPGYLNTTALDAADIGFEVIVVSDACAGGMSGGTAPLFGGLIRATSTLSVMELLSSISVGGVSQ